MTVDHSSQRICVQCNQRCPWRRKKPLTDVQKFLGFSEATALARHDLTTSNSERRVAQKCSEWKQNVPQRTKANASNAGTKQATTEHKTTANTGAAERQCHQASTCQRLALYLCLFCVCEGARAAHHRFLRCVSLSDTLVVQAKPAEQRR